jgi:excisionase family DNA binding protein
MKQYHKKGVVSPNRRKKLTPMTNNNQTLIRLTREEASKALRISLGTLDRRIAEGSILAVRDGKRIFILQDELNRYLRGE